MKPDISTWRDRERYDYLGALTPEGLAWECLRRNDQYQEEYRRLVSPREDASPLTPAQQERWGLRFRGATRAFGPGTRRLLVTGRGPGRAGPRIYT